MNQNIYEEIHRLFLKLQLKRRFVALRLGVPADQVGESLSFTEEAVLKILSGAPGRNVRDLSEITGIERSWMSRVVAGLEDRKLIEAKVSDTDRRSKDLRLTASGSKCLNQLISITGDIIQELLTPLKSSERTNLSKILKEIADCLHAPTEIVTKKDDPVDAQLARISHAFGMVGDNVLNTGLGTTALHVLRFIEDNPEKLLTISDIDDTLPFDASSLSRVISGVERKKLLEKKRSDTDRRSVHLKLTATGKKIMKQYQAQVREVALQVFSGFDRKKLEELREYLDRLTAHMPRKSDSLSVEGREFRKLSIGDLNKTHFSDLANKETTEGSLYGLYRSGTLTGAVHLETEERGKVVSLKMIGKTLTEQEAVSLLRFAVESGYAAGS